MTRIRKGLHLKWSMVKAFIGASPIVAATLTHDIFNLNLKLKKQKNKKTKKREFIR